MQINALEGRNGRGSQQNGYMPDGENKIKGIAGKGCVKIELPSPAQITALRAAVRDYEFVKKMFEGISSENIVRYNIRYVGKMPENGVQICIPYPTGSNIGDTFVILHLVGGTTPEMIENFQKTSEGIQFTCESLSPFAIGWKETDTVMGQEVFNSSANEDEYWRNVSAKIREAAAFETILVNAKWYDSLPAYVIEELKGREVTLTIRWNGGSDIVLNGLAPLPSGAKSPIVLSELYAYEASNPTATITDAGYKRKLSPRTGAMVWLSAPAGAEAVITGAAPFRTAPPMPLKAGANELGMGEVYVMFPPNRRRHMSDTQEQDEGEKE